jgi:hypothetical protein
MKIKSNVRAGSGGASGSGQNGKNSGGTSTDSTNAAEINNTVVTYYVSPLAVSRCVGI